MYITTGKKQIIVGYLGPEGSFSHTAALKIDADSYIPYKTIVQAFIALRNQEVYEIVVPFDNSIEHAVGETIDEIIGACGFLRVENMIILPIEQNLVYVGKKNEIKKVISHPKALEQCSINIEKLGIETENTSSTSLAVKYVLEKNDPAIAAIGSIEAVKLYGSQYVGLGIVKNFQDHPDNFTRFAVISHIDDADFINREAAEDKLDYIVTFRLAANISGQLKRVIDLISLCEINMVKLITRPSISNDPPASVRLPMLKKEIKTNGKTALKQFEDDSFLIIIQVEKKNEEMINKIIAFFEGLTLTEDFYIYGPYNTVVY